MIKEFICIECPSGCALKVDIENCKVVSVSGNTCPKGEVYAKKEVENPERILTSTVVTKGLSLKLVPVRTDRAIPKSKLFDAMHEIKSMRIEKTINAGDVIVENFLGLDVNIIATRSVME